MLRTAIKSLPGVKQIANLVRPQGGTDHGGTPDHVEVVRQAVGAADWNLARSLVGNDAELIYHLGSDFLGTDPSRGLFCRKLAAELAPDRIDFTWPVPWLEIEDGRALDRDRIRNLLT